MNGRRGGIIVAHLDDTVPLTERAGQSVLVAHPGAAHFIYELVNAVGALGFAPRFETGFYYDDTGGLARLVGALPERWRARLGRELGRRHFAGIDPRTVHGQLDLELPYVGAARLLP